MDDIELLKHRATRQYRHNDDNSPDVFNPEDGFVIAYDKEVIDKGFSVLQIKLEAAEQESYREGWCDCADEAVRKLDYAMDNYHSPSPAIEATIRDMKDLLTNALLSLGDFQMAQAIIKDREKA